MRALSHIHPHLLIFRRYMLYLRRPSPHGGRRNLYTPHLIFLSPFFPFPHFCLVCPSTGVVGVGDGRFYHFGAAPLRARTRARLYGHAASRSQTRVTRLFVLVRVFRARVRARTRASKRARKHRPIPCQGPAQNCLQKFNVQCLNF